MSRTTTTTTDTAAETVLREDFAAILARAFAAYGLSVVTDRALPDARDGLKPVQRRILAGMREARYLSDRPTVKSAEVVGLILGNYHPHGDASVYDAAVRLAQPFSLRYPLIEGQGNMGSEDGDAPAAYRYTEMRLAPMAEALMADMERETVPLHPTYKQDPRVQEPDYLPGRIPPVVNPSSGIAVGLSTNIPPHNLTEVLRACIALLDRPTLSVEQLMAYIKGPDFSQGGRIVGTEGIRDYLSTGKGRIIVRAEVRMEEKPRSRSLVVTQLPPVGRDRVKASIVRAINARKLDGVADLRDESDTEKGTRLVLDLRRDADGAQVLTQLFQETDLQVPLSFQMVFLFGEPMQAARQPKQVGMIELLHYWNTHQIDVLTRRSQFELRTARERLHVVEGLMVGAAHAEQIVRIFQNAEDRAAARAEIERRYHLTPIQSEVIAAMTLAQVTRLDASRYAREQAELRSRISELERLLADRAELIALLKREMQALIKRFGDERRTLIEAEEGATGRITEVAPLHGNEPQVVALTRAGALKAVPLDAFAPGGRGNKGAFTPQPGDEQLRLIVKATAQDSLLFVSSLGRVFQLPAHSIPTGSRRAAGEPMHQLLALAQDEIIVAILPVGSFDAEDSSLVCWSALGKVKRSPLPEYRTADASGLLDMRLADGDAVVTALLARGRGEFFVTSNDAQTLRFSSDLLRSQGRIGQGVAAMDLSTGASVVSASYLEQSDPAETLRLLVASRQGTVKKLPLDQFPAKGRATGGVITTPLSGSDLLLGAELTRPGDRLLLVWTGERGEEVAALSIDALKDLRRNQKGDQAVAGRVIAALRL